MRATILVAGLIGLLLLGACSDSRRSPSSPSGFYGEFGTGLGG